MSYLSLAEGTNRTFSLCKVKLPVPTSYKRVKVKAGVLASTSLDSGDFQALYSNRKDRTVHYVVRVIRRRDTNQCNFGSHQ
jgi:hypothetical protein